MVTRFFKFPWRTSGSGWGHPITPLQLLPGKSLLISPRLKIVISSLSTEPVSKMVFVNRLCENFTWGPWTTEGPWTMSFHCKVNEEKNGLPMVCMQLAHSPHIYAGFLQILQLPPTSPIYACEVNWCVYIAWVNVGVGDPVMDGCLVQGVVPPCTLSC